MKSSITDHDYNSTGHVTGIVIIGRNEGERLKRCFRSLQGLGLSMVYVDSASTDGSPEIARAFDAEVIDLDMAEPFTAARARNEGFRKLREITPHIRYVQFLDGDCEVEPGWMVTAQNFADNHPKVAVVCGRRRERFPAASLFNRLCDMEWNTPIGNALACGGDALIRVKALEEIGGYNSMLIAGEEPELCSRLRNAGMYIHRIDAPMTIHDAEMHHFGQWWLRAVRSGFGYAQVWWETRNSEFRLYGHELARTIFWALLLPLLAIFSAFFHPLFLTFLPLIYSLQIVRLAVRHGADQALSWKTALLSVAGKFAELQGMLRLVARYIRRQPGGTIFYK